MAERMDKRATEENIVRDKEQTVRDFMLWGS